MCVFSWWVPLFSCQLPFPCETKGNCQLDPLNYSLFVHVLSWIWLFVALWAVAHQAPLSTEFIRQEYWSGFPFLIPGDLSNPGIEPTYLAPPALADRFFTTAPPGKLGIRVGNGSPLHYSYLENSMDRGAWRITAHGVMECQIWLSDWAHTLVYNRFLWFFSLATCRFCRQKEVST